MATTGMSKSKHIRTWGIVLPLFGMLVLALLNDGIPERSQLTEITGQLRSLQKTTSKGGGGGSVRFSLSNDPRYFSYHSSAGGIDNVWRALNQAGSVEVGILIDPTDSYSPVFDARSFYPVLGVSVGKKTVRSYAEVAASLTANDFTGVVLGYGSVVIGGILLVVTFLRRRQDVLQNPAMNTTAWFQRILHGALLFGTTTSAALWIAVITAKCEGFGCLGVGAMIHMAFMVHVVSASVGGILVWRQGLYDKVPKRLIILEALHLLPVLWFSGRMLLG